MPRKPQNQVALRKQDPSSSLVSLQEQDQSHLIKEIHELHAVSQKAMATVIVSVVELGEKLVYLKKKIPHGSWENFLDEHFPSISKRTLQRYMNFARFVEENPGKLRQFLAEVSPELNVDELSDREVLLQISWDAFQDLYKHSVNEKRQKVVEVISTFALNNLLSRGIACTLGPEIDELFTDLSFSVNELDIASTVSPVPKKSIEIKGKTALIFSRSNVPTSDCLASLSRSLAPDARVLIIAPLKFLSERAYAALPHVLLHGIAVLNDANDSTDYFIGFIGSDVEALEAFKKSAAMIGTFCMPVATQELTTATELVAVQ